MTVSPGVDAVSLQPLGSAAFALILESDTMYSGLKCPFMLVLTLRYGNSLKGRFSISINIISHSFKTVDLTFSSIEQVIS